jgi:uncharacterized coiled-coil protein SlyX
MVFVTTDISESLIDLQTRLAYAEHAHAELDQIVATQDVMIRELKRQVNELKAALQEMSASWGAEVGAGERPPHY